jgi:hypothetical protein
MLRTAEACASAYDVGAPNPSVCDVVETSPAALATVSASARYLDRTVTADLEPLSARRVRGRQVSARSFVELERRSHATAIAGVVPRRTHSQ